MHCVFKVFSCFSSWAGQIPWGRKVSHEEDLLMLDLTVLLFFMLVHFETIFIFCMNRNGIYPLMNFASQRPHPIPRALSLSQEQMETVKTPTPEPQETETRKVRNGWFWFWDTQCGFCNFYVSSPLVNRKWVQRLMVGKGQLKKKSLVCLNISQK